jgi:hypothetical protein
VARLAHFFFLDALPFSWIGTSRCAGRSRFAASRARTHCPAPHSAPAERCSSSASNLLQHLLQRWRLSALARVHTPKSPKSQGRLSCIVAPPHFHPSPPSFSPSPTFTSQPTIPPLRDPTVVDLDDGRPSSSCTTLEFDLFDCHCNFSSVPSPRALAPPLSSHRVSRLLSPLTTKFATHPTCSTVRSQHPTGASFLLDSLSDLSQVNLLFYLTSPSRRVPAVLLVHGPPASSRLSLRRGSRVTTLQRALPRRPIA